MGPLAIIIAVELILTTGILGLSSHPRVLSNTKHQVSNVLGIQQIAQVEEGSDNSSTTAPSTENSAPSQPTDTSAPSDSNTAQPTTTPSDTTDSNPTSAPATTEVSPTNSPSEQPNSGVSSTDQSNPSDSSADQSNSAASPSPPETPGLFDSEINPSPSAEETNTNPTPEEQPNVSPNPQSSVEPAPSQTPTQAESTEIQTQAVLNPEELINSPDNINSQSVEEAKKEDNQIEKTTDPQEQTKLLVTFATDKVKDMSNFTKSDDFTSTNFAAARFNDQIDKAISNLDKLPPKEQTAAKKQLTNFCNQADQVLRTVELSVPEESEQDIQMARGQCQELQL